MICLKLSVIHVSDETINFARFNNSKIVSLRRRALVTLATQTNCDKPNSDSSKISQIYVRQAGSHKSKV